MVIVMLDEYNGVVSREATRWERLLSRMLSSSLDRTLAAGTAPETSALLAVRANDLAGPTTRSHLEESFAQLANAADVQAPRSSTRTPVDWHAVGAAKRELDLVAARLREPGPLPVAGIARLRIILTDGAGPLYYSRRRDALRIALCDALARLEPIGPR